MTARMPGSSCDGRGLKYVNLASQHATAASCSAMLSNASTRAVRTSLKSASTRYGYAMTFQWPGGVGVLRPSFHL